MTALDNLCPCAVHAKCDKTLLYALECLEHSSYRFGLFHICPRFGNHCLCYHLVVTCQEARAIMFKLLTILGVCLLLSGCATTQLNSNISSAPESYNVRYREALTASRTLAFGLSTDQIQALFGQPHTTEGTTCGTDNGKPWPCLNWHYEYLGYLNLKTLNFIFSQGDDGNWTLNSWYWL